MGAGLAGAWGRGTQPRCSPSEGRLGCRDRHWLGCHFFVSSLSPLSWVTPDPILGAECGAWRCCPWGAPR